MSMFAVSDSAILLTTCVLTKRFILAHGSRAQGHKAASFDDLLPAESCCTQDIT